MATGGVTFNGSSQFLEYTGGALATAYPFTLVAWVASTNAATVEAAAAGQGSTTVDGFQVIATNNAINAKYAVDRSAASGSGPATKSTTPNISSTLQLMVGVFTSASSRTIYFGSNTGTTDTGAISQTMSDFNRFVIGAARRGSGPLWYYDGTVAEVHVFNVALTSSDVTTLLTTAPEGISGWVDGWALASASGLTSIGGTRTLTATGSPTNASLTLPYTRTPAPTMTGGIDLADFVTSGAFGIGALSQLAGGITLDDFLNSGTLGLAPGRIDTAPFKNWTGTLLPGVTIPNVVFLKLDRTLPLALVNQVTAGDGVMTISNAALVTGTYYIMVSYNADGSAVGAELVLAT